MDAPLYDEFGNYIGAEASDGEVRFHERGRHGITARAFGGASSGEEASAHARARQHSQAHTLHHHSQDDDQQQQQQQQEQQQQQHDGDDDNGGYGGVGAMAVDGAAAGGGGADEPPPPATQDVVLFEDKQYYASAEQTFGPGVEALVMEEDAQPIEEPIIAPATRRRFERGDFSAAAADGGGAAAASSAYERGSSLFPSHAPPAFLRGLLATPDLVRNVAVVGALHHGKTTLLDMLVEQTHDVSGVALKGRGVGAAGRAGDAAAGPKAAEHVRRHLAGSAVHQVSRGGGGRVGSGDPTGGLRYTDTRVDELERGLSIRMAPATLALPCGARRKHLAACLMDCPGHADFNDDVTAGMRLADGVLLCVDAAEGAVAATERAAQQAVAEGLPIVLALTKVDRLILELKLPPADAYYKLRHVIEEVNRAVAAACGDAAALDPAFGRRAYEAAAEAAAEGGANSADGADAAAAATPERRATCEAARRRLDPRLGNVCFASARDGWSFTLQSFAEMFSRLRGGAFDASALAPRLWGDSWFDPRARTFRRKPVSSGGAEPRAFVSFVLEPLYKLYSAVIGEPPRVVEAALAAFGARLPAEVLLSDARPLLKAACSAAFGDAVGLGEALERHVPSARQGAPGLVARAYQGPGAAHAAAAARFVRAERRRLRRRQQQQQQQQQSMKEQPAAGPKSKRPTKQQQKQADEDDDAAAAADDDGDGDADALGATPADRAAALAAGAVVRRMAACSARGPAVLHAAKQFPSEDASAFLAYARVMSGVLRVGDRVRVLGEAYTPEDDEDAAPATVAALFLHQGRYRLPLREARPGMLVLIAGLDAAMGRGVATIVADPFEAPAPSGSSASAKKKQQQQQQQQPPPPMAALDPEDDEGEAAFGGAAGDDALLFGASAGGDGPDEPEDVHAFRPLRFFRARAVVKVACEPLHPSELPRMVGALRSAARAYPLASVRVEESGEHTVLGSGEMYLDCFLKDVREMYSGAATTSAGGQAQQLEVKVADPIVCFQETVADTSALKCYAASPNGRNRLTMIAEPLDAALADDVERGAVSLAWPARRVSAWLRGRHGWDALAARSVWAFGPPGDGCANALLDDTLPGGGDGDGGDTADQKRLLAAVRSSIVQGFHWGAREGPLCDEPVRGVKWRLTDAAVAEAPAQRGGGQVIPTARRVAYSSFLTASPRLMEPVFAVEVLAPSDCATAVHGALARRRGHVVSEAPRPGTPLSTVHALLPCIESFGFETDLRYHTQGRAFCQSVFDHWQVVPGDPLDRSVVLRPLEPAPPHALAREFVVKTRRRKGLSDDVSAARFFDPSALAQLRETDDPALKTLLGL
jgi:translation elongation factor EF-G